MPDNSSSSKTIAKNTFMLYIRMFVMLAVSLYTSRVVLQVLGETDYGIYNIIGGVVVLFSFLNGALLQATQRFLNFELGRNNKEGLSCIFCMSMNAYLILSLVFLFLAETVGLWFVNTQLNIPAERMIAANWVYQFSIITFIINLIRVPYNATIIAYERMSFFAYVSLVEVVLKLLVVYILLVISWDKLIVFALLYALTPLFVTYIYKVYCNRKFPITFYKKMWDGKTFRQLFSFSGWSLFGSIANLLASHGLSILVNIFHGVTVNAALGIANQVSSKVTQFMTNFQMAFNPQIVKKYSAGETESLYQLIFRTSKFSYFLMLVISLPLMLKMDSILNIWLVEVPRYTTIFSQLILVFMLIEALTAPLWMYVQATGKIKKYQILMGSLIFLNFPFAYIVLKIGLPVYHIWTVRILVDLLVFFARCMYMKKVFSFPVLGYLQSVLFPVAYVSLLVIPLPLFISYLDLTTWQSLIVTVLTSVLISSIVIFFVGLTKSERVIILNSLQSKLHLNKSNVESN